MPTLGTNPISVVAKATGDDYYALDMATTTVAYADEGTLDAGAWPSGYTSGDTNVHTTKNLRACGMEISLLPKSTTLQQISSKDYQTLF